MNIFVLFKPFIQFCSFGFAKGVNLCAEAFRSMRTTSYIQRVITRVAVKIYWIKCICTKMYCLYKFQMTHTQVNWKIKTFQSNFHNFRSVLCAVSIYWQNCNHAYLGNSVELYARPPNVQKESILFTNSLKLSQVVGLNWDLNLWHWA